MRTRTSFPRPVTVLDNVWTTLPDGCRLAARIWIPQDAERDPVPAVLDAVPYRKSDGTAARDAPRYAYIAGHGYACVRLDIRGSGDSDGILADEYLASEQDDAVEVIAWLAAQPWCTGAVGMMGVSWGGFAALQTAARRPPALRGVICAHASDDRYADDVHYFGGCVLALDMLQWATGMLAYLGQPPDPAVVGDRWRAMWEERLDGTPPYIASWLAHQRRDGYWRHGSVREDHAAIACPVLAVGGWADGYRDAVLRLVEALPGQARGLIGPWGHTWPEEGAPGPAVGFLQECVRFFDHCLKGVDNGALAGPALVAFMQEAVPPAPGYAERAGRWVAEPSWPSPNVEPATLALGDGTLGEPARARRELRGLQATGLDGSVWCGEGGPADSPVDQRADDGASLCYDTPPLAERLELLGVAEVVLELAVDRPLALVAARLCDVAPDGASTLVTRGILNLTHRHGHDRVDLLEPGERFVARVPLQSTAYAVPPGHRVRLALSPTYWPWAWPSPDPVTLTVFSGGESRVELPVRRAGAPDGPVPAFGPPEAASGLEVERLAGVPGRHVRRDLATGTVEVVFDWTGDGRSRLVATGTELYEHNVTTYCIDEGDPLSAAVRCEVEVGLARDGWRPRVAVTGEMTADRDSFTVTTAVDAYDGAARVHARRFTHHIPREGG